MAGKKNNMAASLDEALQQSRRDRNAKLAQEMLGTNPQKLAQEMLGKNRRSNTPRTPGPVAAGPFASRAGVTKRSASLPRPPTAPLRGARQPSHLSRPPINDNYRPRASFGGYISSSDPASDTKSNGYVGQDSVVNGADELNIRGAAGGPYIVRAQNFAPGTTAADIESVMANVGGAMNYCKLNSGHPTVIAEMSFLDRVGAEKVIETFNGKKADGRTLYVFMQSVDGGATVYSNGGRKSQPAPAAAEPVEEPMPAVVDVTGDVNMEIDEHADARALENKQREERRGRDARASYPDERGQGQGRANDFPRGPRRAEPEYQDGRYGFNGGDRRYQGGPGGGGGYGGRRFQDQYGRGRGQSYRP